ncbi:MAG: hypothetical protein RL518_273 [Pseudomonadota bacterium]|jgi:hypothetical protein
MRNFGPDQNRSGFPSPVKPNSSQQAQSSGPAQDLQHGFIFNPKNPHAPEFFQLLSSGENQGSDRFQSVRLNMQSWELANRGDTPQIRAAMKAVLEAMEAKSVSREDFPEECTLPKRPKGPGALD